MSKKWNSCKQPPENEEIGTIFEITNSSINNNVHNSYFFQVKYDCSLYPEKVLKLIHPDDDTNSLDNIFYLISEYKKEQIDSNGQWRYVSKNEYMAFL